MITAIVSGYKVPLNYNERQGMAMVWRENGQTRVVTANTD